MTESTPRRPRAKTPLYDVDELERQYPSLKTLAAPPGKAGERAWVAAFSHRPEALESLLSDLIKQAYAKPGRIGQRPMPREEEVNLDVLLTGDYTDEPIHLVLPRLVRISERAFVAKVRISRRMYQRMLLAPGDSQKYYPDSQLLERIAAAIGKPPSYFLEYRLIAAQAAFVKLITERPVVATKIYREYLTVTRQSPIAGA